MTTIDFMAVNGRVMFNTDTSDDVIINTRHDMDYEADVLFDPYLIEVPEIEYWFGYEYEN